MSVSVDHLYALLPALYRERDVAGGGALRELLEVLADELAVVADGVDQLYDDLFVETAAPWALPYIAELIGLRGLPGASIAGLTSRAEVANTIAYRRRKGTAAVLEQVARDTTGWPARAVEYFELLAASQHMNHIRPRNQATVSVRGPSRLQFVGTPFERGATADLVHLAEVRRIPSRRGRYNIPNVGIHLWRLRPYPVTECPATPVLPGDEERFVIDPLGTPLQLFSLPVTEVEITHAAEPINVPLPLARRLMADDFASYYGPGLSLDIQGAEVDSASVCDLSDVPGGGGAWAHTPVPAGMIRVDPVLGRVAFGDAQTDPPRVSYHYGFSADLGGGEYDRVHTFGRVDGAVATVAQDGTADHVTIAAALAALGPAGGTVEIRDSCRYEEMLAISAVAAALEVRAADRRRPVVVLPGDLPVTLADDAEVSINGLVIAGGALHVTGAGRLDLRHCTLVPGLALDAAGLPTAPGAPSLDVESAGVSVSLLRCIVGGIRGHVDSDITCVETVVDAGQAGIALASSPDASGPGGTVSFDECTVLGRVHARVLARASNSIFLAVVPAGDEARWPGPVLVDRRQQGCVRFSYLPARSRTPRRYRCVPSIDADAAELRPVLTSSRYGLAGYVQLDRRTPAAVWRGADDESEMGALHHLQQSPREAYLEARLVDYLRFGLEAGLFFTT
ncbi:hypothetical protein ACLQ2Q_18200 [Microbacterium sp. DT81.1]|uniref:hypothetical protein n=1 Tax=Microbacterium sp. DT81.1 TaxID=3393413 RepID=UPI003CF8AE99